MTGRPGAGHDRGVRGKKDRESGSIVSEGYRCTSHTRLHSQVSAVVRVLALKVSSQFSSTLQARAGVIGASIGQAADRDSKVKCAQNRGQGDGCYSSDVGFAAVANASSTVLFFQLSHLDGWVVPLWGGWRDDLQLERVTVLCLCLCWAFRWLP